MLMKSLSLKLWKADERYKDLIFFKKFLAKDKMSFAFFISAILSFIILRKIVLYFFALSYLYNLTRSYCTFASFNLSLKFAKFLRFKVDSIIDRCYYYNITLTL